MSHPARARRNVTNVSPISSSERFWRWCNRTISPTRSEPRSCCRSGRASSPSSTAHATARPPTVSYPIIARRKLRAAPMTSRRWVRFMTCINPSGRRIFVPVWTSTLRQVRRPESFTPAREDRMKADLTRDTFHPLKHYARVLTQQGRLQLDADMNEQAAILLRYLHILAADLIGPAGGPANDPGFEIIPLPAPNALDFQIGFGNYYVNGLLCQADFVPMAIFPTADAAVFRLMNWSSEFELQPNPYFYEIFDSTPSSTPPPVPVPVVIASASKAQNRYQLTFQPAPNLTGFSTPTLRRLITYLHQPDFVFSTKSNPNSPLPLQNGNLQIYLDVWERV